MIRYNRQYITSLALLMASGFLPAAVLQPLSPDRLTCIQANQAHRAELIAKGLKREKCALGLGMFDDLRECGRATDRFGRTQVRYRQTYRGVEVYNGTVLGHMDAEGQIAAPRATVQTGINLAPATLLPEDRIREIAAGHLPKEGKLWPIQIKPLVFPTKYQDGLKVTRNAEGDFILDPVYSVATPKKQEPYRWAYTADTMQFTPKGAVGFHFVIDAETGEILQKSDALAHADTPKVGTGMTQYSGIVPLNTLQLEATGQFVLSDTTRATVPRAPYGITFPGSTTAGIHTVYMTPPPPPNYWWPEYWVYGKDSNTWGDGQAFVWDTDYPALVSDTRGQTAAADVHYGSQCVWDYYKNVLGRDGVDGQGGSWVNVLHNDASSYCTNMVSNEAFCNPFTNMTYFGDGAETGPLTSLDVVGHEWSHGVQWNIQMFNGMEGIGLFEANADIHATMLRYYVWGANGTGNAVPDATTLAPGGKNTPKDLWTFGAQLSKSGTPLRWLYKPSKNGRAHDTWFDGIGYEDAYTKGGAASRAFFFLSQGASRTSTDDTYSTYLPGGMTGIGNDKAIRIWHQAVSSVTDVFQTYHSFRDAMIAAATELYGSNEVAAVQNAFAAINVGKPATGSEPVLVQFEKSLTPLGYAIIVPAMVPVALPPPTVTHAADTTVTWSLGGLNPTRNTGGVLKDGKFICSVIGMNYGVPVKATSVQDPKQFAVSMVIPVNADCDSDAEMDACDLGAIALDMRGGMVYPQANIANAMFGTDEDSVQLFLAAFNNAFAR
jgi:Zn-dependent metalloprotease